MFSKKNLWCLVFVFIIFSVYAQQQPNDLVGTWLTQKKDGKVELYKNGDYYEGKIVWLKNPLDDKGQVQKDVNNPDKKLRNQTVQGLVIVKKLKWNGKDKWEDGIVYDPDNGKTYSASVRMKNTNTLEFTGYIGFSFIGRTEVWTRVK